MRAAIELSLLGVVIGPSLGPPHADVVNDRMKWANVVQSFGWFPLVLGNLLPRRIEMRFGRFHSTMYIFPCSHIAMHLSRRRRDSMTPALAETTQQRLFTSMWIAMYDA